MEGFHSVCDIMLCDSYVTLVGTELLLHMGVVHPLQLAAAPPKILPTTSHEAYYTGHHHCQSVRHPEGCEGVVQGPVSMMVCCITLPDVVIMMLLDPSWQYISAWARPGQQCSMHCGHPCVFSF